MPLTNTKAVPDGWSEAHQPVAVSAMRSTVDILLPLADVPPGDPWGEAGEVEDVLVPDVPARIRALTSDNETAPSGQTYDTQAYLVQVASHTLPSLRVGKGENAHRIRVTSNPNATGIEGQVLQVLAAPHESESFNRDYYCQVHSTQEQ